jgi:hypothetical protein
VRIDEDVEGIEVAGLRAPHALGFRFKRRRHRLGDLRSCQRRDSNKVSDRYGDAAVLE